jgi:hypothetical protein
MPSWFESTPTPAPSPQRSWFDTDTTPPPSPGKSWFDDGDHAAAAEESGGIGLGGVLGVAALGAAALAAHNPGMVGRFFKGANAVRQQLMLTGLAAPKSMLGNVGAVANEAMETRSWNPLKSFFSGETLNDFKNAWSEGAKVGPIAGEGVNVPVLSAPGRFMGAMDTATQKSLVRSGMRPHEAEAALFQTPLGGQYDEAGELVSRRFGDFSNTLDSPTARYLFPFRRTPYNQLYEGMQTMKGDFAHKGVRNAYIAAGAVHGAATSDEQYPVSIPLATALAAKYGVPYAVAAIAARKLMGEPTGGGIAGTVLPMSEYGLEQSADPTAAFTHPAISRFFK